MVVLFLGWCWRRRILEARAGSFGMEGALVVEEFAASSLATTLG